MPLKFTVKSQAEMRVFSLRLKQLNKRNKIKKILLQMSSKPATCELFLRREFFSVQTKNVL